MLTCERGHRPKKVDGDKCFSKMSGHRLCQFKLHEEPGVEWCDRCDRGIFAGGWCSFCGHVDPRTIEEAPTPQDGQIVTEEPQVSAPLTGAQRTAIHRERASARRVLAARTALGAE